MEMNGNNTKEINPIISTDHVVRSRIFKFRAYNTKLKKWEFGYDYPNLGGFSLTGEVVLMGELNSVSLDTLFNDLVFTQFTGLFDTKGVEIYECDIVKNWGINYEVKYEIYDNIQGFCIDRDDPLLEVIGNIFENKELLLPT